MKKTSRIMGILMAVMMLVQLMPQMAFAMEKLTTPTGFQCQYDSYWEEDVFSFQESTPASYVDLYELHFYLLKDGALIDTGNSHGSEEPVFFKTDITCNFEDYCDYAGFDPQTCKLVIQAVVTSNDPQSCADSDPSAYVYIDGTLVPDDDILYIDVDDNYCLGKDGTLYVTADGDIWLDDEYEPFVKVIDYSVDVTQNKITNFQEYPNLRKIYVNNPAMIMDTYFGINTNCVLYADTTADIYADLLNYEREYNVTNACPILAEMSVTSADYRALSDSAAADAAKVVSDLGIIRQVYALKNDNVTKAEFALYLIKLNQEGLYVGSRTSDFVDLPDNTFITSCVNKKITSTNQAEAEVFAPVSETVYGANNALTYAQITSVLEKYGQASLAGKNASDTVTHLELAQLFYQLIDGGFLSGVWMPVYKFEGSVSNFTMNDYLPQSTINGTKYVKTVDGIEESAVNATVINYDVDLYDITDDSITLFIDEENNIVSSLYSTANKTSTPGGSGGGGGVGPVVPPAPVVPNILNLRWSTEIPGTMLFNTMVGAQGYRITFTKDGESAGSKGLLSGAVADGEYPRDLDCSAVLAKYGYGTYIPTIKVYATFEDMEQSKNEMYTYTGEPFVYQAPSKTLSAPVLTAELGGISIANDPNVGEYKTTLSIDYGNGSNRVMIVSGPLTLNELNNGKYLLSKHLIEQFYAQIERYKGYYPDYDETKARMYVEIQAYPANLFEYAPSSVSGVLIEVPNIIASGNFYTYGLTWVITADGTLSIRDNGDIPGYSSQEPPYAQYYDKVSKLEIGQGVYEIGVYAFKNCPITTVSIPEKVERVGLGAFSGTNLTDVYFYSSNTRIEGGAETFPEGVTIHAPRGSLAHMYASDNNFNFKLFNDVDFTVTGDTVTEDAYGNFVTTTPTVTIEFNDFIMKNFTQYAMADETVWGDSQMEWKNITQKSFTYTIDRTESKYPLSLSFRRNIADENPVNVYKTLYYDVSSDIIFKDLNGEEVYRIEDVQVGMEIEYTEGFQEYYNQLPPTIEGYESIGWDLSVSKMPDTDLVINGVYKKLTELQGIVKTKAGEADAQPYENAKIIINANKETTTDASGAFTLGHYCGEYMITVEAGIYKKTITVSATEAVTDLGEIVIDTTEVGTQISLPSDTTITEIKGVEDAVNYDTLSDTDKALIDAGGTVSVKTEEIRYTLVDPEAANIAAELAKSDYDSYTDASTVHDINIYLVKTNADGSSAGQDEQQTELSSLVTFEIQADPSFAGMNEIIAVREHNGQVDILTSTPNADGEYVTLNGDKIILCVNKFSLYTFAAKYVAPVVSGGGSGGGAGASKYTVKFETNGGSEIGSVSVARKAVVTEPEAPVKEGFVFDGWYTDKECTTKYDFSTPVTGAFTLYAKWTEGTPDDSTASDEGAFADISEDAWYYDVVMAAVEKGFMNGVSETEFAPDNNVTRAMFVTVLHRLSGDLKDTKDIAFADVDPSAYYAGAVSWAKRTQIVSGISETEFAPDMEVTREQMATMLYRYVKAIEKELPVVSEETQISYADSDAISDYAVSAVEWAAQTGIMNGNADGTFAPKNSATRAQLAAVFVRIADLLQ